MEEGWSTTSAKGPLGFRHHCFGSNCFSCHYIDQSAMGEGLITPTSQQQAYTSFHRFWFMMLIRHTCVCSQSRKLNQSWENLISLDQKDLILSFFPHTQSLHLCTVETTTVLHLYLQCVSLFLCMHLWYIFAFLPFVLCADFLKSPLLPLVHNNKKALCVFYIFRCHPAPLEIRGPFFMHGFPQCQLPTHLWIQRVWRRA